MFIFGVGKGIGLAGAAGDCFEVPGKGNAMIRVAVMTFMYRHTITQGLLTHEKLVAGCAAGGAGGLEMFHQDFVDQPALGPLYRRLLADHAMTLPVMDVITNLVYADRAQKQAGIDRLRRGMDVCAEMGTGIAHVAGCKPVEGVPLDDARRMIGDALAEQVDYAAARGITLAIEDFLPSPTLICSSADCREILDRAGSAVKFVFDTGNFIVADEQADQVLDKLYDRSIHFHFKDFTRAPDKPFGVQGCALGDGVIPNRAVAGEIVRRGYDGWVALEASGHLPAMEQVPADLAVLRGMLGL